jgi:hypothetical protein
LALSETSELRRKCDVLSTAWLHDSVVRHARSDVAAAAAKALHATSGRPCAQTDSATIVRAMADQTPTQQPLDQQLQEIGAQLAWVRDYL